MAMLKGFIFGVIATVAIASIGGYVVVREGLVPANADATPGSLETWVAGTSLRATLDREAPKESNPIAMTAENLVAGVDLFRQHCAICRHREGECVGIACCERPLPATAAAGD
jgi:hypothetical protein